VSCLFWKVLEMESAVSEMSFEERDRSVWRVNRNGSPSAAPRVQRIVYEIPVVHRGRYIDTAEFDRLSSLTKRSRQLNETNIYTRVYKKMRPVDTHIQAIRECKTAKY
jgi:hypothetical protein